MCISNWSCATKSSNEKRCYFVFPDIIAYRLRRMRVFKKRIAWYFVLIAESVMQTTVEVSVLVLFLYTVRWVNAFNICFVIVYIVPINQLGTLRSLWITPNPRSAGKEGYSPSTDILLCTADLIWTEHKKPTESSAREGRKQLALKVGTHCIMD